jgi:AcrR family transcriptional regulator
MSSPHMTAQGRATRQRIVAAAATLIGERGVSGTTLDDVRAASKASKSQLYHYFGDKHGLVEAVIDYQSVAVLGAQARALGAVGDWHDLERWADGIVAMVDERGARGAARLALWPRRSRIRTSAAGSRSATPSRAGGTRSEGRSGDCATTACWRPMPTSRP